MRADKDMRWWGGWKRGGCDRRQEVEERGTVLEKRQEERGRSDGAAETLKVITASVNVKELRY